MVLVEFQGSGVVHIVAVASAKTGREMGNYFKIVKRKFVCLEKIKPGTCFAVTASHLLE
jgi:hypothetical protein